MKMLHQLKIKYLYGELPTERKTQGKHLNNSMIYFAENY